MEFFDFKNTKQERQKVIEFLKTEDDDFFPPLHKRWDLHEYFEKMAKGNILYYFENNKIIALINYLNYNPEYNSSYIRFIAVLPEYRHHHLAEELMSEVLKRLKHEKVTLTTWSTDLPAISLYNKFGFKIKKVIKNDRGDGVDTLIMQINNKLAH